MNETVATADRSFSLPLFLNSENKLRWGTFTVVVNVLLYLTTNHFHLFEPHLLRMTAIDRMVPFVPGTFWIYVSQFLLYPMVFLSSRDFGLTNRLIYAFIGLYVAAATVFTLWPTTFPRADFPLTSDVHWLTLNAFEFFRQTDTPANCAPSLHVAGCYLASFLFLEEQKEKFPFYFIWSTLIAISTMTTKQHYFIDVILGFFFAVSAYWVFFKFLSYRPTSGHQANR